MWRIPARLRADAFFGVFTVYLVGYVVVLWLAHGWPPARGEQVAVLAFAPVDAVVAVLAWLGSRRLPSGSRGRLAWVLLALACACSMVVDLDWVYYNLTQSTGHQPWPIYVIDYAHYGFTLAALALMPRADRDLDDHGTFVLDAGIVLVASAVLTWLFLVRAVLAKSGATPWNAAYTLSFPVSSRAR